MSDKHCMGLEWTFYLSWRRWGQSSAIISHHRSVHIGLDAAVETDVSLYISYVVSNSSWSPSYDIRVLPDENLMRVSVCVCECNLKITDKMQESQFELGLMDVSLITY